ncbi:MAG: hypothetical protein ACYTF6_09720, partial [Planctomycetota bacterium]
MMGALAAMDSIVRFAEPWWLLGLAAVLAPPGLAILGRRRGRGVSATSVILQCAAVVLLALALGRLELPLGERADKPYLVFTDVSTSVRGQEQALALPESLPRQELRFAATVAGSGERPAALPTNAAPPLWLAAARADEIAGVVMVTDGQFHDDWPAAAARLGRTGMPVAIVPLDSAPADARVARISAVRRTRGPTAGAVDLRITVTSNAAQSRLLTVRRQGLTETLAARWLTMPAGDTATVSITDRTLPADRAAVYFASLAGDADA